MNNTTPHRPRVFVVQEPMTYRGGAMARTIDISPAEDYGELFFLFHDNGTSQVPRDQQSVIAHLLRALGDFRETDYLLPTGAPCLIAWASIIAAKRTGGRLQLLEWERGRHGANGRYRVVRGDMDEALMVTLEARA